MTKAEVVINALNAATVLVLLFAAWQIHRAGVLQRKHEELLRQTRRQFYVQGDKNPVRVAKIALLQLGVPVDEESFDKVAEQVGDIQSDEGFFIRNVRDIDALCAIGDFRVVFLDDDGRLTCVKGYQ